MKKFLTNILNSKYIFIVILCIFFEPQMFKENYYPLLSKIDFIYKILKIVCVIFLLFIYFKNKKISKLFILMTVFQCFALFSTVIGNGSISRFIGPALTTLAMIMLAEILINRKELFSVMKICIYYFRICFIINIISIIIIDFICHSDIKLYFLGIDNRFIFTYLPWISFEFMYSLYSKNKIDRSSILSLILCELTLFYRFSVAAMFTFCLWAIIFINSNHVSKFIKRYFICTLGCNVLIVLFKVQNLFKPFLDTVGKDITLSGRTYLWDAVFNLIKSKPLFGNGMQSVAYDKNFFFHSSSCELDFLAVSHAHNSYVTVLYRYGIIGLIIYLKIFWTTVGSLSKNFNNKYAKVLSLAILISLILAIFDTIDYSGLYFLLALACSINLIGGKETITYE